MAVAALQRVIGAHARPLALCEVPPKVEESLTCGNRAEDVAPDLLGRLHFPRNLPRPLMWHMAIRAARAHAGPVGEMDGALQLLEDVAPHLMAADTEFRP